MGPDFIRGIVLGLFTCPFLIAGLLALWMWRMNRREKLNRIGSVISPNRKWQVVTWQTVLPSKEGEDRGWIKVGITDVDGRIPDEEVFALEELRGEPRPIIEPHWITEYELVITFSGRGRVEYRPSWAKELEGPPDVVVKIEQVELDRAVETYPDQVQNMRH